MIVGNGYIIRKLELHTVTNLVRITTAKAIMWCDVFHIFVRRNKKRKPVMEGNFRLHITIEGHIADSFSLFRYFKNIWPLLLTLNSLNKNTFLPTCCRIKKACPFMIETFISLVP